MNKGLAVLIVIGLSIGGVVGYMKLTKKATPVSDSSPFSSIKDALTKSISLKCEYPDQGDSNKKVVTYVKNGAVRMDDFAMGNARGNAIIRDNKMYIWSNGSLEGTLINLDSQGNQKENVGNQSAQALADLERYKSYCKAEIVSDAMVTPPTEVNFVDFAKSVEKMTQDALKNVPTGLTNE